PHSTFIRLIGQALGDFYVSCPVVEFAQRLATTTAHAQVYQYVWSRKVASREVPCAQWMGACHGSDVVMLFGEPFEKRAEFTPEDRRLSAHFMKTIGEFLHFGYVADRGRFNSIFIIFNIFIIVLS